MQEKLVYGVFTDRQFWKICDARLGEPLPFAKADLTKPYVYDRKYGVFWCPMGHHQAAMSLLLAFHLGFDDGISVAEHLGVEYSCGTADYYLENIPGTCFKSSVSKNVQAGRKGNLSPSELRFLGPVIYSLTPAN